MAPFPTSSSCTLFLLRHGATLSNQADPPILQGQSIDGPLAPAGIAQAQAAGRVLSRYSLQAIYSSPLRRGRQTAEIIAEPHGLTVGIVPEIIEVDVGSWERKSWAEIREADPEAYANFQTDPARFGYRDGENLTQVRHRVVPAFEKLMHRHLGQQIAVVGHHVVNRAFLAHALGLPLALARQIHQANGGINVIQWEPSEWKIVSLNATFHLDAVS